MMNILRAGKQRLKRFLRFKIDPRQAFHSDHYLEHNQRRQEHLESLGLSIRGRSVLEVGGGIGDHTQFFIDRGCPVVTSDGRPENVAILRRRYPDIEVRHLDMDHPPVSPEKTFDIVYCYGLLYHLKYPAEAIRFLAKSCQGMLLLETLVSYGDADDPHLCREDHRSPTQSVSGIGCRPTRRWVMNRLQECFPFAYMPLTQPRHREFPLDWKNPSKGVKLTRSVFIGSRTPLVNGLLTQEIPMKQTYHGR